MRDGRENAGKAWFSARTVLCLGKIYSHSKLQCLDPFLTNRFCKKGLREKETFCVCEYLSVCVCVCVCVQPQLCFRRHCIFCLMCLKTPNTKLCNCNFDTQVVLGTSSPSGSQKENVQHYHITAYNLTILLSYKSKHAFIPVTQIVFLTWTTVIFCFCFFSRCYSSYVKELKTSLTVSKQYTKEHSHLLCFTLCVPSLRVTKQLMRDFLKYISSHTSAFTLFLFLCHARTNLQTPPVSGLIWFSFIQWKRMFFFSPN